MIDVAKVLVFAVHLMCVDLAAAGPLVATWLDWRAARYNRPVLGDAAKYLAFSALAAGVLGIAMGLLTLVLLRSFDPGRLAAAFERLPGSEWWMIAAELLVYFALLSVYVATWNRWRKHRFWHRLLAILAGTNLLYHFPPLFVVVSIAGTRPELSNHPLTHAFVRSLLLDPETVSRTLHHWLAAFAVSGVFLAGFELRQLRNGNNNTESALAARFGARLALAVTLLQIPVGVWLITQLPAIGRESVLGEDAISTALLVVSLTAALGLMHFLASAALGTTARRTLLGMMGMLSLVILLMSAVLHRLDHIPVVPN